MLKGYTNIMVTYITEKKYKRKIISGIQEIKLNKKHILASIFLSLNELDKQNKFKIADQIFNSIRFAQEKPELKDFNYFYNELLPFNNDKEGLKAKYRILSLKFHPDLYGGDNEIATENFKLLNSAYRRLLTQNTSNSLSNTPIEIISITINFQDKNDDDDHIYMDENEAIEFIAEDRRSNAYFSYYRRMNEKLQDKSKPVRISLKEKDLVDIANSACEIVDIEVERLKSVDVTIEYLDLETGETKNYYDGVYYGYSELEDTSYKSLT